LQKNSQNKDSVKDQAKTRINLYVKRVLIGKEFDEMLPFWMNEFICGVIDSDDLPLNVSRETINQTKVMKVISKKVTRKIIERLEEFAEEQEKEYELDEQYLDDKENEE
jgi:molecular chaperone HtpG